MAGKLGGRTRRGKTALRKSKRGRTFAFMPNHVEEHREESRPSWIYPQVWLACVVIFVATPYVGLPVGLAAFLLLMGILVWNALSRKRYAETKESHPSLTRADYVLNSLLLPVGVPLVAFGILLAIYLL